MATEPSTWMKKVEYTPEMAAELVSRLPDYQQRVVDQKFVDMYARDMRNRVFFGESCTPIKLDTDGRPIDGQHRLRAVMRSGMTVTFWTMYNVPKEHFVTFDGRKRQKWDMFIRQGERNTIVKNTAVELLYGHLTGIPYRLVNQKPPTPVEKARLNDRYGQGLDNSVLFAGRMKKRWKGIPQGAVALSHYLAYASNADMAEQFFSMLEAGSGEGVNCPAVKLNNKFSEHRAKKMPAGEVLHLFAYAWNKFLRGERLTTFRIKSSFDTPAKF